MNIMMSTGIISARIQQQIQRQQWFPLYVPPVSSFSTSRNQYFFFLLLFFDIFSELGVQK